MDGFSATRRIRKRDELRAIPVLFLSGYAYPADLEAAFGAGGDECLAKCVSRPSTSRCGLTLILE